METETGAGNTIHVSAQDTELGNKSQEWSRDFDMVKSIFFVHSGRFPTPGPGVSHELRLDPPIIRVWQSSQANSILR
ncbi:MAG: hypothetical protein CBE43_03370 [Rhodopirellula sp. TMED283]|nr:MAG: hypothetical protein CBE43_03370 [Rhodopirellula sp. TMED283]